MPEKENLELLKQIKGKEIIKRTKQIIILKNFHHDKDVKLILTLLENFGVMVRWEAKLARLSPLKKFLPFELIGVHSGYIHPEDFDYNMEAVKNEAVRKLREWLDEDDAEANFSTEFKKSWN